MKVSIKQLQPINLDSLREPELGEVCMRVGCDGGYALSGSHRVEWGMLPH